MGIIAWIVFGFIVGLIARAIVPGRQGMGLLMTALLGIFIVGGVGFSHIEAVHNAAHDYRHSMAFPCH